MHLRFRWLPPIILACARPLVRRTGIVVKFLLAKQTHNNTDVGHCFASLSMNQQPTDRTCDYIHTQIHIALLFLKKIILCTCSIYIAGKYIFLAHAIQIAINRNWWWMDGTHISYYTRTMTIEVRKDMWRAKFQSSWVIDFGSYKSLRVKFVVIKELPFSTPGRIQLARDSLSNSKVCMYIV